MDARAVKQKLLGACQEGDDLALASILNKVDQNILNEGSDDSPLIIAVSGGHTSVVKSLLERGAKVDVRNGSGMSGLMIAARKGDGDMLSLLLEHKAQVDLQDRSGYSALMWASENGYTGLVKTILDNESNVNLRKSDGKSALMLASENGHTEVAKLLLSEEYKSEIDMEDEKGQTALKLASAKGHFNVVQLLIAHNAGQGQEAARDLLKKAQENSDIADKFQLVFKTMFDTIRQPEVMQTMQHLKSNSGSVEPPETQDLGTLTIKNTFQLLFSSADEWENIGVFLDVPEGVLNTIAKDNSRSRDCLREMLKVWLKQIDPRPTWKALAEAVEKIDPNLSKTITDKYVNIKDDPGLD